MHLLNIIEEKIKKIKDSKNIEILELVINKNNTNINFLDLENKIDYKFENEFKDIYLKYSYIKIVWEIRQTEER